MHLSEASLMPTILAENAEQDFARYAERITHAHFVQPVGEMLQVAKQGVRDNFTSSADPDNQNWLPRKREGDGHPLLIDTGALLQAATGGGAGAIERIGRDGGEIGVDTGVIQYAAVHNFGSESRNIPAREFMGVRAERADEMGEILADFVEGLL